MKEIDGYGIKKSFEDENKRLYDLVLTYFENPYYEIKSNISFRGKFTKKVKLKDNISVEMQCISRPTYLYYYSLNQQSGAGPGGGITPANPTNNIQGGALGIFSAHTVEKKLIRVQ